MNQKIILCFFSILVLATACTTTAPEFVVTFDGNSCIAEGPSEVLPGEYTFKFIDKSDIPGKLWLHYIDEGITFQDHLDLQSEPGEWYEKPSWAHFGSRLSEEFEETDESKVAISVWNLDNVKEYTIMCYVNYPRYLWFAAPIFVVETLSD